MMNLYWIVKHKTYLVKDMEIKEIDVVKKEKVYMLTEQELTELKGKERAYGSRKTKEYIGFCWNNFYLQKNVGGCIGFIKRLLRFLEDREPDIPNTYGWSLSDWLKQNR